MKTFAVFLAVVAIVYAEAEAEAEAEAKSDPQFMGAHPSGFVYHYQTYHNTPAATAPLVTAAAEGEEATQKVMLNPYSGAYNPYWYNGLYNRGGYPGYGYGGFGGYGAYNGGYGAYPYGAGAWNGAYGGYPGYGFGYGARPYGAGAWNYGLPQFVPAAAPEAAPTSEAAPAPAAEE